MKRFFSLMAICAGILAVCFFGKGITSGPGFFWLAGFFSMVAVGMFYLRSLVYEGAPQRKDRGRDEAVDDVDTDLIDSDGEDCVAGVVIDAVVDASDGMGDLVSGIGDAIASAVDFSD